MPRGYQNNDLNPVVKFLVLLLLASLALWMLLSPHGLWQYGKISRKIEELQAENHRLEEENRQLLTEITRLRNDPQYIEEVARRKHGLLKKNELIFHFKR